VFGKTMVKLGSKNPRIVAITAAMEYGTGLVEFGRLFPDRFFDVGIAEQHGVIFAAGLASEGYRPVVAIYSTFMQRGYDHIVHDVCMQKFPVVLAMDRAGLVGEDGPTHHGVFDIAFCRTIPHLVVMAPSDECELADMLATALTLDSPCAIRYPRARGLGRPLKKEPEPLPVGKGRMLVEGDDLLIMAVGSMVAPSVEASRVLAEEGIRAGVLDARFVKPLDADLIVQKAAGTGRVLTVEEGILAGGFGSAVLELLAHSGRHAVRITRLGIPDGFVEHATREQLLEELGLTVQGIADQGRSLMEDLVTSPRIRISKVGGLPR
jgi:1-deoxy-D-xylulose-5-phosphate synthase